MPNDNDPSDKTYRLISLDDRDVEDLRRLLGKLRTGKPAASEEEYPETPDAGRAKLEQRARALLESRRRRVAIFGPQMFAEPAWDMLLILYLSGRGRRQTQTSLGELSGASRSTATRWIDYLSCRDLIRREDHPTDRRRNFVSLTQKGQDLLDLYLSETG
jgi:DNA-binding MarR family transcriptional regulator